MPFGSSGQGSPPGGGSRTRLLLPRNAFWRLWPGVPPRRRLQNKMVITRKCLLGDLQKATIVDIFVVVGPRLIHYRANSRIYIYLNTTLSNTHMCALIVHSRSTQDEYHIVLRYRVQASTLKYKLVLSSTD